QGRSLHAGARWPGAWILERADAGARIWPRGGMCSTGQGRAYPRYAALAALAECNHRRGRQTSTQATHRAARSRGQAGSCAPDGSNDAVDMFQVPLLNRRRFAVALAAFAVTLAFGHASAPAQQQSAVVIELDNPKRGLYPI